MSLPVTAGGDGAEGTAAHAGKADAVVAGESACLLVHGLRAPLPLASPGIGYANTANSCQSRRASEGGE